MKTSVIMCFAIAILSLVVMILSGTMGTHESTYSLPDGSTLTVEQAYMPKAYLDGQLIQPNVTNDYEIIFWSSFASAMIFAFVTIPIILCEDRTKAK